MYYKGKIDSLNSLIKVVIEPNNKLYKLAIAIYYCNSTSKTKLKQKYAIIKIKGQGLINNLIKVTKLYQ